LARKTWQTRDRNRARFGIPNESRRIVSSLRTRLFIILVSATSLIWLFAIGWISVGTKHEVEHVLDSRPDEGARMVSSLVTSNNIASPSEDSDSPQILAVPNYERQLSCQIWSLDG